MILQRIGNQGLRLGRLFERAAARYPANVLILDHSLDVAPGLGRRATTAEVADLVDELSARLWWARVRPGERVAVYKGDGFDITLLACAASRIGAVPVLLSPSLAPSTAAELLARAGRPHLLTDETTLNRLRVSGADVSGLTQSVLLTAGTHPDARNLRESSDTPRVAPVDLSADHPALVTHTSGTTGVPKLAVHTARSLQARYRPQASTVIPLILGREPIAMHVSFVHSRLVTALAIALRRGWPVLMLRDAETSHVAELFARLRPGILEAHPNSFLEWEELVDDPRRPLSRVKLFSSTFDAIHPRTVHRLLRASERRAPVFGQLYGQSEVGPAAFRGFTRSRSLEDDGRCVGVPFPGFVDVRVVSRNGQPPSAANPGHIEVRSDGRVITYIGESERYRQQMSDDGWWRMGDVGYRTKWGCVHLLDREVDLIEGFGSTLAVEDALFSRLPGLAEVVIVPDAEGQAVPVVCTRDGRPLEDGEWEAAIRGLPTMREPVHWQREDLPQTATQKTRRLELARLVSGVPQHQGQSE